MDYNFCFWKISSRRWSRMERSLKQRNYLQWQEVMALMCRRQGWPYLGPWGRSLVPEKYCNPIYCKPNLGPWLFFIDEIVWLHYRPSTTSPCAAWIIARTSPNTVVPHIPLPCMLAKALVKVAMIPPSYLIKKIALREILCSAKSAPWWPNGRLILS